MKQIEYHVIRVQGSDADLLEALNTAGADGWELVTATAVQTSVNAAAENKWVLVFKR